PRSFAFFFFFFYCSADPRDLHSFPTRRSSDLWAPSEPIADCRGFLLERGRRSNNTVKVEPVENRVGFAKDKPKSGDHRPSDVWPDRKSTRLNSSHSQISYAVFCLKKKKKKQNQ